MAEVQPSTESGEMTQLFIEFVMMQQQQAAFSLGLIPSPHTGKPEVRLDYAKLFIDQLVMIRTKTNGNLSPEESRILASAISNLQMAFVEVTRNEESGNASPIEEPAPAEETAPSSDAPVIDDGGSSSKRFTKSYGA